MRWKSFLVGVLLLIEFVSHSQNNKIKIACIGNSVTYGWGLKNPGATAYPTVLQQKMGSGYEVRNFGHSGSTLLRKGHNPYFKTEAFQEMLQYKPDIAIIDLGLNDTDPRNFPNYRDAFIPDYNWLIDTIKKISPAVKIYICTLTPVFTGHSRFMSSTLDWYWILQKKIKEVAAVNHLPIVDLNSALHDRPDLFTDAATLHPNEEGAAIIAETVYKQVTGDFGGLQLPALFTNNMVLQRRQPIRFWGLANAGTPVAVTFKGKKQIVKTGYDGKWQVVFSPSEAVTRPQTIEIRNGQNAVLLQNVLVGDVWLCSGQSNMYFPLSQAAGATSILSKTDTSAPLRLFKYTPYAETDNRAWTAEELIKSNELNFFSGNWQQNSKNAAATFSAVGYVFGTEIVKEIKVPVGLIEIAVGGSPLISWVSRYTLEASPLFEPAFKNWLHSDYIMQWCRDRAAINLKGATAALQRHPYEPSFNFEAGIARLVPFPIKGILWYQGESDADNAELYEKLFPLFTTDWRKQWQQELPFYYVQLSSIERPSWNYFRDAQRRLQTKVAHSGMVVTSDLGDSLDVHYKNKIPVGKRLARLALNKTYNVKIVPSGPLFRSLKRVGNTIEIEFDYAAGLRTPGNAPLKGFEIVTNSGQFTAVAASIKNNKVSIRIPRGNTAQKIAYGWQPFTRANLINAALLPASTFIEPIKQ